MTYESKHQFKYLAISGDNCLILNVLPDYKYNAFRGFIYKLLYFTFDAPFKICCKFGASL